MRSAQSAAPKPESGIPEPPAVPIFISKMPSKGSRLQSLDVFLSLRRFLRSAHEACSGRNRFLCPTTSSWRLTPFALGSQTLHWGLHDRTCCIFGLREGFDAVPFCDSPGPRSRLPNGLWSRWGQPANLHAEIRVFVSGCDSRPISAAPGCEDPAELPREIPESRRRLNGYFA